MCGGDGTHSFGDRWFNRRSAKRLFDAIGDRGMKPTATFGGRSATKDKNQRITRPQVGVGLSYWKLLGVTNKLVDETV